MPIEAFAKQHCSVARPLAVLGERWTFLVLRELFLGFRRFDEMQGRLGIATNVLSSRLQTLVDEGIVERRPYGGRRDRFEYRLTEKGRDLQPVLLQLMRWSDEHMPVRGGAIHELTHTIAATSSTRSRPARTVAARPTSGNVIRRMGPGATAAQRRTEAEGAGRAREATGGDRRAQPA